MPELKDFTELSTEVRSRPGAAARIEARKAGIFAAIRLAELREERRQTQQGLADLLGTTQANVSRMEHTDNPYLGTLADYISGLGGRLEINAVFDDDTIPLGRVGEGDRESAEA